MIIMLIMLLGCCSAFCSALRPGAVPGRPVAVEPFSASLRRISTSKRLGISATTYTHAELQTACPLTDIAGHEFLYALSHSCACGLDGLHDLILALELLLVLKAAHAFSFSGITIGQLRCQHLSCMSDSRTQA